MGYRCPVCEDPHPDGEHLANHMAFTGLLGDDVHEEWLDETVPSWSEMDPDSLGEALTEEVPEVELRDLETSDPQAGRPEIDSYQRGSADQDVDPDIAAVLEEARELTREMHGTSDGTAEDGQLDGDAKSEDESEGEDR